MLTLRKYQESGVDFLTSKQKHAYLADDMGLGKTIQSIVAINRLGSKSLIVICPASVKRGWARELIKHADAFNEADIFVAEGKKNVPTSHSCVVINYDLLVDPNYKVEISQWAARRGGVDHLVMDEAHYLKNPDSKRSMAIMGKGGLIHQAGRSISLSGTPMLNRPVELFLPLLVLAPSLLGEYNSLETYGKRYCKAYKNDFGWDYRGASNTEELGEMIAPFFLRRKKSEVEKELPNVIENVIPVKVKTRSFDELPLATQASCIGEAKLPKIFEYVKDILEVKQKVVIFAHHRSVISSLADKLKEYKPQVVWGGMTSQKKQASIDAFVSDEDCRIFIGQTQAAGVGIDGLQGVCDHIIFAEMEWSPGVMDQAIGRLHRIGQKSTVVVDYMVLLGTLDDQIQEVLDTKRGVIQKIIDLPRNVIDYGENDMSLEEAMVNLTAAVEKLSNIVYLTSNPLQVTVNPEATAKIAEFLNEGTTIEEAPKTKAAAPKGKAKAKPEPEVAPEEAEAEDFSGAIDTFVHENIKHAQVSQEERAKRIAAVTDLKKEYGVTKLSELTKAQALPFYNALLVAIPITTDMTEEEKASVAEEEM